VTGEDARRRAAPRLLARLAVLGPSSQAAIPGLYAWGVTVVPAAWSRGAWFGAKVAAVLGVVALASLPLVENVTNARERPPRSGAPSIARSRSGPVEARTWSAVTWARLGSIWGFVLSSAVVWAVSPGALSSARLDGVRGALGMVGWALFAFASAGPALRAEPNVSVPTVAGSPLRPRSEVPRGDGAYVAAGAAMALGLQAIGWEIASAERAVLVRLVTIACGIAVLGATTSVGLARHVPRVRARVDVRLRRGLPWVALLTLVIGVGLALSAVYAR
jgi:hypothetical protein